LKVLGIESSSDFGGAAITDNRSVPGDIRLDLKAAHTERLMPIIDRLFRETGIGPDSLEGIAVSLGPGGFTGLRSGLGLGKGLAYARGIPIAGVPTLETLALIGSENLRENGPSGRAISRAAVVSDARRGEILYAVFRECEGYPVCEVPTSLGVVDDLVSSLRTKVDEEPPLLVVDESCPADPVVEAVTRAGIKIRDMVRGTPDAVSVARLGAKRLTDGRSDDVKSLVPLYIRPSDAEVPRGR